MMKVSSSCRLSHGTSFLVCLQFPAPGGSGVGGKARGAAIAARADRAGSGGSESSDGGGGANTVKCEVNSEACVGLNQVCRRGTVI